MVSQNYPDSDDYTILGCLNYINIVFIMYKPFKPGGCRGCDRTVVGFTTTCAIGPYHY